MTGFDWDEHNVAHIARHNVAPNEVEELLSRKTIVQADPFPDEERFDAYGTTAKGRYLVVVFTMRGELIRCVSAWPMNESTRKKYAAKLK